MPTHIHVRHHLSLEGLSVGRPLGARMDEHLQAVRHYWHFRIITVALELEKQQLIFQIHSLTRQVDLLRAEVAELEERGIVSGSTRVYQALQNTLRLAHCSEAPQGMIALSSALVLGLCSR